MRKQEYCKRGHLRSPDNIVGRGYCRKCSAANSRLYYKNNLEKQKAYSRNYSRIHKDNWLPAHLRKTYGITLQQYNDLNSKQNGLCAICKKIPKRFRLSVDHDHTSNKIRGLLCDVCNRIVLPVAERYSQEFFKAIDYLEGTKHDATESF